MSTAAAYRPLAERLAPFGPHAAPYVARAIDTWRPYKAAWNYEDGCVWKGALDLADATGLRGPADFVYREVSARVGADGALRGYDPDEFNIDNVNAGKLLAVLHARSGEARFGQALARQLDQLARHPRTASGNYWHKRIYPHQVWLDGLYMAQPLRCLAAPADASVAADVAHQFAQVRAHLRDPHSGLYVHGWDESRSERWADPASGRSANVWGRAMGWYAMALVDCIDALGSVAAAALAAELAEVAAALLRVRSAAGLWRQLPALADRPGNDEEASASLMIAYALMKGARLGVLDRAAGAAGEQALQAALARFLSADALHGICGVAGLGNVPYRDGSVAYYLSEPIVADDPKGVGALLMALAEGCRRLG